MQTETENLSELLKAGAALVSTASAVAGAAISSPVLLLGAIAVAGVALYSMMNSEQHGRDDSTDYTL